MGSGTLRRRTRSLTIVLGLAATLTAVTAERGAAQPPIVEGQKAVSQLAENLTVDAFIQVWANFKGTRHRS